MTDQVLDLVTRIDQDYRELKIAMGKVSNAVQLRQRIGIDGYMARVELPNRTAADEASGLVERSFIPVTVIEPGQLSDEFIMALTNRTSFIDKANRYVQRWPGVVQVTPDIYETVKEMDAVRENLVSRIAEIPKGRPKRRLLEHLESHLNLNYLRRKVLLLDQPLDALAFRWEGLGYSHRKLDSKQIATLLETNVSGAYYEKLKKICSQQPVLYQRFYQAPSIFAQYKFSGSSKWHRSRVSLPIVTTQPLPTTISRLKPFDNTRYGGITSRKEGDESIRSRKARRDRGSYTRISEYLHLYRRESNSEKS